MNYVGIDIGSTASKVVVRGDNEMYFVLPTGWSSKETTNIIRERLKNAGVDVTAQETKVVATGYGRVAVDFADKVITKLPAMQEAGGSLPVERTIIDVGGQDTKVIQVSNGVVMDFLMNDKCSAGTGKFLEIMANRLGITLDELFDLAKQGKSIPISSLCTVFAESEVISYIGEGRAKEDIAAGVIESVVAKVAQLAQRQALADTIILTGGLSHSTYFTARLSERLGKHVMPEEFGRFAGALGAAYLAEEKK
ncbi:MAG: acyl-CoA dehydratase activase [[Clostridium] nexile]